MKTTLSVTIDADLAYELKNLDINISKTINDFLWTLVKSPQENIKNKQFRELRHTIKSMEIKLLEAKNKYKEMSKTADLEEFDN